MTTIKSRAAFSKGNRFEPYKFDPGPLGADNVEIALEHCGICHSDLSILENDWCISTYPMLPSHAVVGRVVAVGDDVQNVKSAQGLLSNRAGCRIQVNLAMQFIPHA
jgi:uncharacterized zinc-type alcohol dehydrogenase-like protein